MTMNIIDYYPEPEEWTCVICWESSWDVEGDFVELDMDQPPAYRGDEYWACRSHSQRAYAMINERNVERWRKHALSRLAL